MTVYTKFLTPSGLDRQTVADFDQGAPHAEIKGTYFTPKLVPDFSLGGVSCNKDVPWQVVCPVGAGVIEA
jgi:hypothetical protein